MRKVSFLIVMLTAGFVFLVTYASFLHQLNRASQKPFWGDETFGLTHSIKFPIVDLIVNGASGQGSPSPLDYIALRFLDHIHDNVAGFGLSVESYYRLFANVVTVMAVFVIFNCFLFEIVLTPCSEPVKRVQFILLSFFPVAYLFSRSVYYYAAEARPYSLWNAAWLVVLAVSLLRRRSVFFFMGVLLMLALSATASIYQIGVMAGVFGVLTLLTKSAILSVNGAGRVCVKKSLSTVKSLSDRSSGGCKSAVPGVLKIFALPLIVALYYALRAGQWDMQIAGGTWDDFWRFWKHKSTIVPLMAVAVTACFMRKENRAMAIAPVSFLLLYLAGPLLNWITNWKGFFYAERQYIYYDLLNTVFILTLIQCLPALARPPSKLLFRDVPGSTDAFLKAHWNSWLRTTLILALVLIISASVTFRPKVVDKMNKALVGLIQSPPP